MLLGILLLIWGVLALLESTTTALNFGISFYVYVSIFACGLYQIIKNKKFDTLSTILTLVGLVLALTSLDILPINLANAIFPIIIIVFGVVIIYYTSGFKKLYSRNKESRVYKTFLSERQEKIKKIDCDIDSYTIFGSVKLDLSDVKLENDTVINVYSIFGESTVLVSDKYNVDIKSTSFIGEIKKNVDSSSDKNKSTIYINCISIIGGAKIKKND